jgi:SAM-dependent methyltransferase
MIRQRLKWWLFPGVNLHARLRNRVLPSHFRGPENGERRLVLDAGCGNGMLAYQSYLRGNRVLGISIKPGETERNERLFNDFLGIARETLSFQPVNIYDVESLGIQFDEIICTEVLEHIARDQDVCRSFCKVLRPGGVLHLCCPNAEHADHRRHHLDPHEAGGHVRAGYTFESYRQLLEPLGFRIEEQLGIGGPVRQTCNKPITAIQEKLGVAAGVVLFLLLGPLALLDKQPPLVPYSLYVKAVKS